MLSLSNSLAKMLHLFSCLFIFLSNLIKFSWGPGMDAVCDSLVKKRVRYWSCFHCSLSYTRENGQPILVWFYTKLYLLESMKLRYLDEMKTFVSTINYSMLIIEVLLMGNKPMILTWKSSERIAISCYHIIWCLTSSLQVFVPLWG